MTSEASKKNMLIIDGNSILNRAFFGMPALTNSRGADTGALYGMMTIILPKLEQLSPSFAAVAYDLKAPTFRHKLFDAYKAGRKPMPPPPTLPQKYSLPLYSMALRNRGV